ncbi:PAS domain S-box protein [Pseudooceanicola sediminis]|uniref:PAS domain S-box protein n=1 Tax=Pseudooceanicola sediminis TaxID=2211117 RepID=A0A399J503_9RHOB|nr:PAS domain-containing methyl-accepting chemotaxis protein [Pseudooceanicola sediminis]RII37916.1 PAS domain S-box protein [Pseudooceanicola sediminis]|tara:strand:- start:60277 stop:62352 length:2076 start_codon:yes stop_codon:yes gene_type:complete
MLRLFSRRPAAPSIDSAAEVQAVSRSHIIVRYDMEGIIREVNDQFCRVTGYTPADVVGKPYLMMVREKDHDLSEVRNLWRDMAAGKMINRIVPRLNSDGEEIWFDVTYTPVTNDAGTAEHVLSIAREISHTHFRRRDNRSQVDAIRRTMAVVEFDLQGNITDANDLFLKTMGYRLDELQGKHHRMLVPPEDASSAEYKGFWDRMAKGASEKGEVRRLDKRGKSRWLEATYETLLDPEGRPFKVVKYAFDITNAKNLAADAASQIAAINRVQAVIEFDTQGNILAVNDTFCAAMGYAPEEIRGKHHRMFVSSDFANSPDYDEFWKTLRSGKEHSGNFTRIGKGGKPVYIRASYNPIRNAAGEVVKVVKYAIDTTALQLTVDTMQSGLDKLADGDLSVRLDQNLGEMDAIRQKFNIAVTKVDEAMQAVLERATQVHTETGAIISASNELSRRTETQAATLEETAVALNELAGSVKQAAATASVAQNKADEAKTQTEESGRIVRNAVSAMEEIEESSSKISSITKVIDDIAFQTNLLALNAGVEAARAGEAGRGFAVVAQEVRALAQRSSEAAKEIASLISDSTTQVVKGVNLVGQAGQSITTIDGMVRNIHDSVSQIAISAHEQANGITEMNMAMNQLDQVTQENAAMAEETNAATQNLASGIAEVQEAVSFFGASAPHPRTRSRRAPMRASA